MKLTHQDIIDRLEALGTDHSVAYKAEKVRQEKERANLKELCGELGHFYEKSNWLHLTGDVRHCVFCKVLEPSKV